MYKIKLSIIKTNDKLLLIKNLKHEEGVSFQLNNPNDVN